MNSNTIIISFTPLIAASLHRSYGGADGGEALEQLRQLIEGQHVGTVTLGLRGLGMSLDKQTVGTHGYAGAGNRLDKVGTSGS